VKWTKSKQASMCIYPRVCKLMRRVSGLYAMQRKR
jgi:hypothetical protein